MIPEQILRSERPGLIIDHGFTPGRDGRCDHAHGDDRCAEPIERHRIRRPVTNTSTCRHCGEPIHVGAVSGRWMTMTGGAHCVAGGRSGHHAPRVAPRGEEVMRPRPDVHQLDHEPIETLTSTPGPRSAGCRQCGHVIVQRDGVWASAEDGVFCPSSNPPIGSHRPDDEPPAVAEPDSDPDDPDETERLLTMAIAIDIGHTMTPDPDTWQPPEDILERARERLRAWSEVRG